MSSLAIIGHLTIDQIKRKGTISFSMGGPPAYGGITAARIGAKVSAVSKVGVDYRDEYLLKLIRAGIDISDVHLCPSPCRTTNYYLSYEEDERELILKSKCEDIYPKDISKKNLAVENMIFSPVAGEIPLETLRYCVENSDAMICLDPQGYLREFDENGKVRHKRWENASLYLESVDILKLSERESIAMTGTRDLTEALRKLSNFGPKMVIISLGERGSIIFDKKDNKIYDIPAIRPRIEIDFTGCGDAFFAAFLIEYQKTKDVYRSGIFGSSAASFVAEGPGLSVFGTREEIEERIKSLKIDF